METGAGHILGHILEAKSLVQSRDGILAGINHASLHVGYNLGARDKGYVNAIFRQNIAHDRHHTGGNTPHIVDFNNGFVGPHPILHVMGTSENGMAIHVKVVHGLLP